MSNNPESVIKRKIEGRMIVSLHAYIPGPRDYIIGGNGTLFKSKYFPV